MALLLLMVSTVVLGANPQASFADEALEQQLAGLQAQLREQVAALAATHAQLASHCPGHVHCDVLVTSAPGAGADITVDVTVTGAGGAPGVHTVTGAGGAPGADDAAPVRLSRSETAKMLFREFMSHDNFLHHGVPYDQCVPDMLDQAAGCEHCCSNCMDLAPLYVAARSEGAVSDDRIERVARAVARNGIEDGQGGVTVSPETIAALKEAYERGDAALPDEFPDFIGLRRLALWDLQRKGVAFDSIWERSGLVLQEALFEILRDPFMAVHMAAGATGEELGSFLETNALPDLGGHTWQCKAYLRIAMQMDTAKAAWANENLKTVNAEYAAVQAKLKKQGKTGGMLTVRKKHACLDDCERHYDLDKKSHGETTASYDYNDCITSCGLRQNDDAYNLLKRS